MPVFTRRSVVVKPEKVPEPEPEKVPEPEPIKPKRKQTRK